MHVLLEGNPRLSNPSQAKIRATERHTIKTINTGAVFRRMDMHPDTEVNIHQCDYPCRCLCDFSSGWIGSARWNRLKSPSRPSSIFNTRSTADSPETVQRPFVLI